jgi:hypothetical protein
MQRQVEKMTLTIYREVPRLHYFAQIAISAPLLVSGLAPHETDKSDRYVAGARFVPQKASMTISSSWHVIVQSSALLHGARTRRNCDEAPAGPCSPRRPGGPCGPMGPALPCGPRSPFGPVSPFAPGGPGVGLPQLTRAAAKIITIAIPLFRIVLHPEFWIAERSVRGGKGIFKLIAYGRGQVCFGVQFLRTD